MVTESPNIFLTLIAFIALIGSLVVVHELGHYSVGRWFGVKAEKFSIGFGPQIWGRVDKRGTLWRIGLLPLGGFVQFAGDMNPSSQADESWRQLPEAERNQTFQSKTLWQRALIVFAGPAVNFLLAILIAMGFLLAFGKSVTPPVLDVVQPGSPAAVAGLMPGDRVLTFNGRSIETFDQMANEIIIQNAPVTTRLMAVDDAIAEGARALFGEKYGDEVRVVSMGTAVRGEKAGKAYSIELCGGTHVSATGDIGLVRLVGESAVGHVEADCRALGSIACDRTATAGFPSGVAKPEY